MQVTRGYLLCLAYVTGLLFTGFTGDVFGIPVGAIALLLGSFAIAIALPRLWRMGPDARFWIVAGLVSSLAFVYLQIRTPHAGLNDFSRWQQRITPEAIATVYGKIDDDPRLTSSQRVRFVLKVTNAMVADGSGIGVDEEPATGKAYVTVGLLQGTGLHPGQSIAVTGVPYLPKPARNPGGFDFAAYLQRQGIFSGLMGERVDIISESFPLLWQMRQSIVRAIVQRLGTPEGTLLSAMVLGRRAVDLPNDVRHSFTQAGLAHTIAASGFHTSLLLGVVLFLTQRFVPRTRCLIGTGVLLVYVGLTGAQPSVIRAGLMGLGALIGSTLERKSKPVAMLLLIATFMLLVNPLWVWDLGFQLSFLATLGLLVLAPALIERLDWMPKGIATLVTIPLAACLWTLPIQLGNFGAVPTYSILLNVLATPLILVISLGGMVSAAIALLIPLLGGWIAWCLQVPILTLLALVDGWNRLPGNMVITGSLTVLQILSLYGIYGLVWWQPWWQRRWWLAVVMAIALITVPVLSTQATRQHITVLAASEAPAIVVQERNQVGLIFGGTDADAHYTVLPFLRSQGIRSLAWAIALDTDSPRTGWPRLAETLAIQTLYYANISHDQRAAEPSTQAQASGDVQQVATSALVPTVPAAWLDRPTHTLAFDAGQQTHVGPHLVQFLNKTPTILRIQMGEQMWLICDRQQSEIPAPLYPPETAQVVWWKGDEMDAPWIEALKPQVAIAPTLQGDVRTHGNTPETVTTEFIQVYETDRVGALQWTLQKGFEVTSLNTEDF